jgi:hypothetical protein
VKFLKLPESAEDVELRILRRVRSGESRPKGIDPVDLSGGSHTSHTRRCLSQFQIAGHLYWLKYRPLG